MEKIKSASETQLVSVVITTYNRSHYLNETIESIHNQTYTNFEVIVVDDGSNGEDSKLNRSICSNFLKCQYFYKSNTGQPDSRNYGIKKSKGVFIGFCDDDDVWVLDKLEKQLEIFSTHPDVFIVTGDTESITKAGERTGDIKSHAGFNHGYIFNNLLIRNRTASIIPLIKRAVFDKVGYFNPAFTIGEDWEFWRRVSYYYEFYAIPTVLGYVRLHDNNMSLSRSNSPSERVLLYRKLTIALLAWGANRFTALDVSLIQKTEWQFYRKLITNNFSGILKKIEFIIHLSRIDIKLSIHLILLALKFKLRK